MKIKKFKPKISQIIIWVISLAIGVGLFFGIRNLTACWRLTALPGSVPQSCQVTENEPQPTQAGSEQPAVTQVEGMTPEATNPFSAAPDIPMAPAWDGVERVTVLIIGLDARDWEAGTGAPRSDTMMLISLDPLTKKVTMLSIPRDMWVNIPDFGYNRINTAYSLGESWKLTGGGPGLAIRTVEDFLGVPISYYAQVDFHVFERLIDEIGGVIVTPEQTVVLDRIGDGDIPVTIQAGETVSLPGDLALAYARARKTKDGDIDRAKRQQELIVGIQKRIFSNLKTLLPKTIPLYNELSAGINTNMTLDTALGFLFFLIDSKDEFEIEGGVIDFTMAEPITLALPDGGGNAEVLKPIPDQIRILRDQLFESGGALSPLAWQIGDLNTLIKAEGARISLFNSTADGGITDRTSNFFIAQGLNIISVGNSTEGSLKTIVIDHTGNPYTLKYLVETMNLSPSQITTIIDFNAASDVEIHLGNDWVSNNPLP